MDHYSAAEAIADRRKWLLEQQDRDAVISLAISMGTIDRQKKKHTAWTEKDRTRAYIMALRSDAYCIGAIPPEEVTADLCKFAIERNARAYCFIPEQFRSEEMALLAVNRPDSLTRLDDILLAGPQTPATIAAAVARLQQSYIDSDGILSVIDDQTPELLSAVLPCRPQDMMYVKDVSIVPNEVLKQVISKRGDVMRFLNWTDERFEMVMELIIEAYCHLNGSIPNMGDSLQTIPAEMYQKHPKLVDKLIEAAPYSEIVNNLPREIMSQERVEKLLWNSPSLLPTIPYDLVSDKLFHETIRRGVSDDIDSNEQTRFVNSVKMAVAGKLWKMRMTQQDVDILSAIVPHTPFHCVNNHRADLLTENVCINCLKVSPYAIDDIPEERLTPRICKFFLEAYSHSKDAQYNNGDGRIIGCTKMRFSRAAKIAVDADGTYFRFLPMELKKLGVFQKLALKHSMKALPYLPYDAVSKNTQIKAVKEDPSLLYELKNPAIDAIKYAVEEQDVAMLLGQATLLSQKKALTGHNLRILMEELGISLRDANAS